jgi:ribosomal protein S27AE
MATGAERLRKHKAKHGGAAAYKKMQRDRSPSDRQKYLARKRVEYHVKVGNIKKEPCARCGITKSVQAHHEDYSKPLDVIWLCAKDHKARHREMKEAERLGPA